MSFLRYLVLACAVVAFFMGSGAVKAGDGGDAAADGPPVHFVELNPLLIPVINENGVSEVVSLVVAVEVDSQAKADKVTKYSPRLTDAFLSDLYGVFSHPKAPKGGIIPIATLKKRLNAASAKVLGDDVVTDVLLQVLQKRST